MAKSTWLRNAAFIGASLSIVGCGSSLKTVQPQLTPHGPPEAVVDAGPAPVQDPVASLIAASQQHFVDGERELALGHLEQGKKNFDLAVDVLLQSPYGARSEPRIRDHFDRLVERVSAYEITALAQGDGFAEKKSEPASIDDLLALSTTDRPAPTTELHNTVESDLSQTRHDVEIPLNSRVLSYIELFQGNLRDFIGEGLQRGTRYLPMIQDEFRKAGLPLDLAYVPLIESAFKPNALSRAKAKGVWQFMSGTALENGLRRDWYIDERSDPEKATVAAAKYLRVLSKMFDGDWHLALASYNGGPGRMQRAMNKSGLDDFWALSAKPRLLPRETREYVPMILAAMVIARNPSQYGFDFEPETAPEIDKVTLPRPVDLRRVAEWTDTTIDHIQALNPELRRWTTPVKDTKYQLKVPAGTAAIVTARLTEGPSVDLASLKYYTVKRGETLLTIARKLRVSRADLAEANYLKMTSRVAPGQKLMVPHEATVLMAAQAERPAPATEARTTVTESGQLARAAASSNRVKVNYEVRRGDTLASIARLFKTTVASIKSWNPRLPGTQLLAGQRLTVYRLPTD